MRFVGNVLQFVATLLAFCIVGRVIPSYVLSYFSWIAQIFLCFNLALWILEFTQDYFFTEKVDTKNKAVLITGCDTGFGNGIARILDRKGYQVFACCLDDACDGAHELKEKCSSKLKIIQMDVTKDESVSRAVQFVENELGQSKLWAVINNAGILKGFHTELSTMKDYEICTEVNILGVVRVTKAFLPFLRKSQGRVVNICSMAGRNRGPYLGAYTISKTGVIAFTEVLVQEMREFGVRVISIEPEFFSTQMCSKEYLKNFLDQSLAEIDDNVKSAYGPRYIEKSKEIYFSVFLRCSTDVQRVFDAMESAVSLQNPADVYKPTRNIFTKILFFLSERVPKTLVDITVIFLLFVFGLPKPRTGINFLYKIFNM